MSESAPLDPQQYDRWAEQYQTHSDSGPNAYCERPSTVSILPTLQGINVIDAACGHGFYAAHCLEAGAHVEAFDGSRRMIRLAESRLGGRVTVRHHDLRTPLDWVSNGTVDLVICALALDYVEHLPPVLSDVARGLRAGGSFVFSIVHPSREHQQIGGSYFDSRTTERPEGRFQGLRTIYRPLDAFFEASAAAQLVVDRLLEARPVHQLEVQDPALYARMKEFPRFLSIRLRKPDAVPSDW